VLRRLRWFLALVWILIRYSRVHFLMQFPPITPFVWLLHPSFYLLLVLHTGDGKLVIGHVRDMGRGMHFDLGCSLRVRVF